MTCDVIPFDTLDPAGLPFASQTQVVGALPPYMGIAEMVVQCVRSRGDMLTPLPSAFDPFLCVNPDRVDLDLDSSMVGRDGVDGGCRGRGRSRMTR